MRPEEYAKMYDHEDTYWWFQGRQRIVAQILARLPAFRRKGARCLDLGCGTGLMLRHLEQHGWVVGLDFSPLAIQFSKRRGASRLLRADVQALPIADRSFDVITALDITEHVERDDLVFSEALRILKQEGRLVLTVPAHPFLWSDHDDALFHYRRYTRAVLEEKILAAGFEIERLSYCITFTSPIIVGFRILQRLFQKSDHPKTHLVLLPRWANRLLTFSVQVEATLLKWINLPFGITLLAVARKKNK